MALQHRSNSFYPKFLIETSHSAPPPCRETARLAEKLPLLILICARHQKDLLNGKGNFSARLCSERAGGGASLPARARRNSPHTPFRRALAMSVLKLEGDALDAMEPHEAVALSARSAKLDLRRIVFLNRL